jgi:2-dehydropantoate 2-reductase
MQNRRPRLARVPVEFIGDGRNTPIQNLILATKSYQAEAALTGILPRLKKAAPTQDPLRIFILSEGALSVRENLQHLFSQHPDLVPSPEHILCTTTHGVIRDETDDPLDEDEEPMIHLSFVGQGRSLLGGAPGMAQLWDQSGLNATSIGCNDEPSGSADPMEVVLWKKLAGNCFCGPLTALWGVTNGDLLVGNEASTIRQQVVKEILAVARALHPSWPETVLSETTLDDFVEQVIHDNLDSKSSMYYDLQQGRRTEVESLNGFIVRKATTMGIETPANRELLRKIQDLDGKHEKT